MTNKTVRKVQLSVYALYDFLPNNIPGMRHTPFICFFSISTTDNRHTEIVFTDRALYGPIYQVHSPSTANTCIYYQTKLAST